jgi:ParB-like chromosome segregation protein Spo0J
MHTTCNEAARTPKLGNVKPIDIFSPPRRKFDEDTVADFVEVLARDDGYLHPITVWEKSPGEFQLVAGAIRLEAWIRRYGNQRPIPAIVYPPNTPEARITMLEFEENSLRKDLTASELRAGTLRYAAARKRLDADKPATRLPVSGSNGKSASAGGRGKKAATAKVADKLRLSKPAVQKRIKAASAAIGETIDLDHDTPEELERKADKLKHAEAKVERPKRSQPALRVSVKKRTPPAEPQAPEVDSPIEALWKGFDAIEKAEQLRFIYYACLGLGLNPLKMASRAAFGLLDEEPELVVDQPGEAAPAIDDAPVGAQAEQQDEGADVVTEDLQGADDGASQAATQEPGAADLDAEHLQDAAVGDYEAVDQEPDGADLDAGDLQDSGGGLSEHADQEPVGATKCAYCNIKFESGDQLEEFNGKLYHGFCVEDGKRLAKAKQGKQVAIAA